MLALGLVVLLSLKQVPVTQQIVQVGQLRLKQSTVVLWIAVQLLQVSC
jgi:hypothetical protein